MSGNLGPNRSFDLERFKELVERTFGRRRERLLAAYFAVMSYLTLARLDPELLGVDAAIYYRAAAAYRSGTSPWAAVALTPDAYQLHFAALPPTVLAFLPFTELNERSMVWLWLAFSVAAAFWIVRRLSLPWWWWMFPPLVQGVFSANPQIVLLALLLTGSPILGSLAPMLKVYAIAPLVGERKYAALLLTVALLGASWLVAPQLWSEYLARSSEIGARLMHEAAGGYSALAYQSPWLVVVVLAGLALLAIVALPAAGWLTAPALVPAAQFHLSTMAMPVLASNAPTLLIVAMAFPLPGLPGGAIAVYGAWRGYAYVRERRLRGQVSRLLDDRGLPVDTDS